MTTDFHQLDPVTILEAIESLGFHCSGQLIELNSYENRVYQVGIEESEPIIAKFYRPLRWSDEQILEEHLFTQELSDNEITVVPALRSFPDKRFDGETLHHFESFRFTLYQRFGGRTPDIENENCLEVLGRYIGRIHLTGANRTFSARPDFSLEEYGHQSCQLLLSQGFLPTELEDAYQSVSSLLLEQLETLYPHNSQFTLLRLHGDCHMGNVLWRDDVPHFVDFDDARNGLAIQDIWMLLSGDRDQETHQLKRILTGYRQFAPFEMGQIRLIESLRTMRMMYYSAWIARRWEDPAFPRAFPWFNTEQYWGQHILELKEQASRLQEPPLEVFF